MQDNAALQTPASRGRGALNVCLTPALIPLFKVEEHIVVVIDIFRATSSICYGIGNGAEAIIPVAEVEECLAYQEKYPAYLLAAERNGEVVAGFDFGNSPFSYTKEKVQGKTIVLTTTNGTHALHLTRGAKKIIIGSFFKPDGCLQLAEGAKCTRSAGLRRLEKQL